MLCSSRREEPCQIDPEPPPLPPPPCTHTPCTLLSLEKPCAGVSRSRTTPRMTTSRSLPGKARPEACEGRGGSEMAQREDAVRGWRGVISGWVQRGEAVQNHPEAIKEGGIDKVRW